MINKSEILKKSNECFKSLQYDLCKNLIERMERIQLSEFQKNRFKCQSSIIGLQTELIESYYFKSLKKNNSSIMIPYVIKNC